MVEREERVATTMDHLKKMPRRWKQTGHFARTSVRIINHRSNAHFGQWARQMWFKINIKNPFPCWTAFHHAFYWTPRLWHRLRMYRYIRVRKKQLCEQWEERESERECQQNHSHKFHALSPFSLSLLWMNSQRGIIIYYFIWGNFTTANTCNYLQNTCTWVINFINLWQTCQLNCALLNIFKWHFSSFGVSGELSMILTFN